MGIDLQQIHLIITALLPVLISLIAGILRQDKLPMLVNEAIAYALVGLVALMNVVLDGKITGNPQADFMLVVAYSSALISTPPFRALQQYLQSNIFSLGSPAVAPAQPQASIDAATLAQELLKALNMPTLAVLLAQELVKIRVQPPQSTPQQAQLKPVEQRPTVATQAVQPPQAPPSRGG